MEKLSIDKRAAILRSLVEGASAATTSRVTGTAKNSVLSVLVEAGEACSDYMDREMVNLPCRVIQMDEVHGFVGCHEKNKAGAVNDHPGDVWLWTCLDADSKLIPSWRVGDRSANTAWDFCTDLARRFRGELQITTDGHAPYRFPVQGCFPDAHFGQLIKIYGTDDEGKECVVGSKKITVRGNPDASLISTSYVERSNLTLRMSNRRYTRRTNGYSKIIENHCHMLAVMYLHYNYGRRHMSLGKTPAMAAGLATKIMRMEEVVEMVDAYHAKRLEEAYEAAFAAKYTPLRETPKAYDPLTRLTPWYLDPESGGRNCHPLLRKPGVNYDD